MRSHNTATTVDSAPNASLSEFDARGIPNARRDEDGLRYTTFHVHCTNPKHMLSNYLKNAQKKSKARQDDVRGSQIIVIHPGSRFLRIGKASDVFPIAVPTAFVVQGIYRPRGDTVPQPEIPLLLKTSSITVTSDDPCDGPSGFRFHTRDYGSSVQAILADVETVIQHTLRDRPRLSVVLVVPDCMTDQCSRIREYASCDNGVQQLCAQQESLAATYGAGLSNAVVACVDEDNNSDTRHNLARSYDWSVMEDLKARLCTLAERCGLNLYDFVVRQPFKPAEKYGLRAYDESYWRRCSRKARNLHPISHPDISDEILEHHDTIEIGSRPCACAPRHPGGFGIDVCFEASKLPLDVAIFIVPIRKYLQAVLVIAAVPISWMAHGLERLQAIATPLVADMEKVQIIPPPKEVDPTVLAWKGAAVLGKMDGVSELWVTQSDWDVLGLRGLKERCFFL
ncbi:hypothetical protein B0H13DRAFT_2141812 [Mycena leptocephala]|nr:hypothetical protein B0H13DRAFT_2141812 [Mycena leptocephala]